MLRSHLVRISYALGLACLAACDGHGGDWQDAAVVSRDAARADAAPPTEAGVEPEVDFAVSGCPSWECDAGSCRCVAIPPLTLTFLPSTNTQPTSWKWDFGDESTSEDWVATHTYRTVGRYTVSLLVRGDFGILSRRRENLVSLRMAEVGEPCEANTSCLLGLCLCASDPACPVDIQGLCTEYCEHSDCLQGVCVDLTVSEPADGGVWRRAICLARCFSDEDCTRPGFRCLNLPLWQDTDGDDAVTWERACFPPVLGDLGEPCLDATGQPSDLDCASGTCLDVGASGMCSGRCGPDTCPLGTACVQLGPTDAYCLPTCRTSCSDPLLACRREGGTGAYSVTFLDSSPDPDLAVCAPKPCTADVECAPLGRCRQDLGGYCTASER